MTVIDPAEAREFAKQVVTKLRAAGYESLWAGGCVRDQLLGLEPKDYDVATNALPDQIRDVFGKRRTLPIGAAFGVITVLGPRTAGQIEVATFRRDAAYSDGRHPDSVAFSNAKEDACRRDFTINGLFYDPLSNEIIDYVGGKEDLARKVIRAIGIPEERLAEDKLRMLRAVRFATTLSFEIEQATLRALQEHANELSVVSIERITSEFRRLLTNANRKQGLVLLQDSGLLAKVFPELLAEGDAWHQTLDCLDSLQDPTFAVATAVLLRELHLADAKKSLAEAICRRLKLSNEEREGVLLCLKYERTVREARTVSWPVLQRVLINDRIYELISYCETIARVFDGSTDATDFCRQTLARPQSEWNPMPLISGDDLSELEISPGPAYRTLLDAARDAQLNGEISDRAGALALVRQLWDERSAK